MSTSTWQDAFIRDGRRIREHSAFAQLVHEVGVAEQPKIEYSRLAINSINFRPWMRRGMTPQRRGPLGRRAQLLAQRIASELGTPPGWAAPEWVGRVYVEAARDVRCRGNAGPKAG